MNKKQKLNNLGNILLGIIGITFVVFSILFFSKINLQLPYETTESIQSELTGNTALDKEIIRSAKHSNGLLLLMHSMVVAGLILIVYKSANTITKSILNLIQGDKPNVKKRKNSL